MLVGGVDPHRYDLSSMVMLKDNHIWSTGSVTNAVKAARSVCGFSLRIDVEVQQYDEAVEAIEAGADVIMLDNMQGETLVNNALRLKQQYSAANGKSGGYTFLIESSGGIDIDNVQQGGYVDNGKPHLLAAPSSDYTHSCSAFFSAFTFTIAADLGHDLDTTQQLTSSRPRRSINLPSMSTSRSKLIRRRKLTSSLQFILPHQTPIYLGMFLSCGRCASSTRSRRHSRMCGLNNVG
jgi:hypothetical protein